MLIQLRPDYVASNWNVISKAIEEADPPYVHDDPEKMNNVLRAILSEKMHCWAYYGELEGKATILGFIVTTVIDDPCSGVRNLLIYSMTGYNRITLEMYKDGFSTLKTFARSAGCHRIIAYTNSRRVAQVSRLLGGETEYILLKFEVAE